MLQTRVEGSSWYYNPFPEVSFSTIGSFDNWISNGRSMDFHGLTAKRLCSSRNYPRKRTIVVSGRGVCLVSFPSSWWDFVPGWNPFSSCPALLQITKYSPFQMEMCFARQDLLQIFQKQFLQNLSIFGFDIGSCGPWNMWPTIKKWTHPHEKAALGSYRSYRSLLRFHPSMCRSVVCRRTVGLAQSLPPSL